MTPLLDKYEKLWTPEPMSGCYLWMGWSMGPSPNNKYPAVVIKGNIKKVFHRMVCAETHGAIPDGMVAAHLCNNKFCVNPAHMYVASKSENCADQYTRHGKPKIKNTPTNITWVGRRGVYRAQAIIRGRYRYIGEFRSEEAAVAARDRFREKEGLPPMRRDRPHRFIPEEE